MQRHGFKFVLASGELAVWCSGQRYPGLKQSAAAAAKP